MTAVQLRMERFPKGRNYPHGSKGRVKPVLNFHKKYLGNTAEGQGFADKTKKKAFYQYKKLQAKEHAKSKCAKLVAKVKTTENVKKKKVDAFKQAEKHFQKRKHEKEIQHKEMIKKRKERDIALKQYSEKKQVKHKKLCKRTYKGQPVMANQMDLLLKKIEAQAK